MLGLQGNASSSKEYRCVACSATFTGLASLLVHQATHAGTLPKPPQNQSDSNLLQTSALTLSSEDDVHLPKNPSNPFYLCDCGEEFKDFSVMMDHKQSHYSELQCPQPSDNELTSGKEEADLSYTPCESPTAAQTDMVPGEDSTAGPSDDELSSFTKTAANVTQEDSTAVTNALGHSLMSEGYVEEQLEKTLAAEEMPDETEGNEVGETGPQNRSLMKILASAYGKHFVSPQCTGNNGNMVTPKEEPDPVVIAPQTTKGSSTVTDMSAMQLRRLLGKPGMKTKAPSISRLLESSAKKIVSLTKIFSPVVLLETRQRFMDPSSNSTYGKYQCARCRRVFQNVDSLTEHHFLHKKERIKCCRRCKQLIIGRIPFPDNHVCPQSAGKSTVSSFSFKSNATNGQKSIQINSLNNRKKVYFCPICKHNYARRYNLKMHKCRGPVSSHSQQAKPLNNTAEAYLNVCDEGKISQSIGVGTQVKSIKIEENADPDFEMALSNLTWTTPPSIMEQHKNASAFATSFLQVQDSSWVSTSDKDEDSSEGQWTVPLDDEMETLPTAKNNSSVKEIGKSVSVSHSDTGHAPLRYLVKDGVRRYPCDKCQQTFCSSCSLSRHQKLCCIRPKGLGSAHSSNAISLNANNVKMYPCYVCGRNFNRKDNMMVHRKKCELRRTMIPNVASEIKQSLPPSNAAQCQTQEDDGGSWSIMSLPSVLPRRVTCECGLGFTSPKLLLEHLQKHAQESYTCPTCGVTVNSWADYEIHLQIHMHPHHQKRSQPLLLRFKQPTPGQQPSQSVPKVHEKQPLFQEQLPHQRKKQPRIVCTKCGNTFASRCSLRRHISWNRCKGLRITLPNKTYHCSHCNSDFPNAISLLFHQRGGTCKPAIKPVRCPVCLRWFTTTDGLQKHLLAHKNSETFRCDVCQGTYPSLKSLKIHRRRIHRIMAGGTIPYCKEQAIPGSVSG